MKHFDFNGEHEKNRPTFNSKPEDHGRFPLMLHHDDGRHTTVADEEAAQKAVAEGFKDRTAQPEAPKEA